VSAELPPAAELMWANDNASQSQGIRLDEVADGFAIVSMKVTPQHANGLGVCHGGLIFLLADTAMAFASNSTAAQALAAGASIEFLRPARVGDVLRASAVRDTYAGRTSHWTVTVVAEIATPDASVTPLALFHGRTVHTRNSPDVPSG
jgi:acyl-CoA thioesterase